MVREITNGYNYPISNVKVNFVVTVPFILLISVLFTLIVYPMVGLNSDFTSVLYFVLFFFLNKPLFGFVDSALVK